jgi:hypothetical protein
VQLDKASTGYPPPINLSREERRLIEALRSHPWGEATVILKGGKPVMVKGIREDVKLTDR